MPSLRADTKADWLHLSVRHHMVWLNIHASCNQLCREGKEEHPLQQILLSRLPPVEMMVEVRGDVGSAVMPKFAYSYHIGIDPGMPTPLLFRIN